jgi:hypothetical protein
MSLTPNLVSELLQKVKNSEQKLSVRRNSLGIINSPIYLKKTRVRIVLQADRRLISESRWSVRGVMEALR